MAEKIKSSLNIWVFVSIFFLLSTVVLTVGLGYFVFINNPFKKATGENSPTVDVAPTEVPNYDTGEPTYDLSEVASPSGNFDVNKANTTDPDAVQKNINEALTRSQQYKTLSYNHNGADGDEISFEETVTIDKSNVEEGAKSVTVRKESAAIIGETESTHYSFPTDAMPFDEIYDNYMNDLSYTKDDYDTVYTTQIITLNKTKAVEYTITFKDKPQAVSLIQKVKADTGFDGQKIIFTIGQDGKIYKVVLPMVYHHETYKNFVYDQKVVLPTPAEFKVD